MTTVHHTLRAEEQERANRLVRQLARLLGAPFGAEENPTLPEVPLLYALYGGWRLDVYLELPETDIEQPTRTWVLILSRGDQRAYRVFAGEDGREAAGHICRFVTEEAYRRLWLEDGKGRQHPAPQSPDRRILVIEDKKDTAEALRLILELVGYEVRVAGTGADGIQQATAWGPDAVLCDIGLPGMDGYAVAERLRRHPVTARVCLVAVTAYGSDEDRARARAVGFDHHFTKPADPLAVLQVLPRPAAGKGIG